MPDLPLRNPPSQSVLLKGKGSSLLTAHDLNPIAKPLVSKGCRSALGILLGHSLVRLVRTHEVFFSDLDAIVPKDVVRGCDVKEKLWHAVFQSIVFNG